MGSPNLPRLTNRPGIWLPPALQANPGLSPNEVKTWRRDFTCPRILAKVVAHLVLGRPPKERVGDGSILSKKSPAIGGVTFAYCGGSRGASTDYLNARGDSRIYNSAYGLALWGIGDRGRCDGTFPNNEPGLGVISSSGLPYN